MKELRACAYALARALVLFVLATLFIASSAAAYVALWFFWPMSSVFVVVWAVCRVAGLIDANTVGVSVEPRAGGQLEMTVGGSDRPMGRRVLATIGPSFSVELAHPRWYEATNAIVWAPFFLQGPVLIGVSLLQLARQEEPQIVVEWSWLPIGLLLVAGFVASAIAFVSYAARQFVAPATIGRRIQIPLTGYALCAAHRDVCAIEILRGPEMTDRSSSRVIRFIRTGGESEDLTMGAPVRPDAPPPHELIALAKVLAQAARVPLRAPSGEPDRIRYAGKYDVGLSPHDDSPSRK